jgi:DNA-binding response OmpR family regulator
MATVLLAIEQWPLLEQIRRFLEADGYRVVEAAAVGTALEMLDQLREVELLLADVPLPYAAGLAGQAVERCAGIKVLLISGEPEFVNRELVPEAEIGFIEKPFAWCELKRTIDELLFVRIAERNCKLRTLTASSLAS